MAGALGLCNAQKLGAIFGLLRNVLRSTVQRIILQSTYSPTIIYFQEEDNNDLNQVVASSGFSEKTRVWVGFSVSRNHKTWSRWFLLKDFLFKIIQASVWKRGVFDITMTFFILTPKKSSLRLLTGLICTQPWQRWFLEHCQCEDFGVVNVLLLISDGVWIMSSKCWAKIAGMFTMREPIPAPPPRELFCAC